MSLVLNVLFFVLTIDYRILNLCDSDRKQVLSVKLMHCNMTFVGLVIKTIYCNTSSVPPFRGLALQPSL